MARPVGQAERLWRWCRRKPMVAGLTAAVAALLLAAAAIALAAAVRIADARKQEAEQRRRADANFARAKQAVDDFLVKVTNHPKLLSADFYQLRKELLETALPFCEEFVRQQQDDPGLGAERGIVCGRLGLVRRSLGENPQAIANYQQAKGGLHAARRRPSRPA